MRPMTQAVGTSYGAPGSRRGIGTASRPIGTASMLGTGLRSSSGRVPVQGTAVTRAVNVENRPATKGGIRSMVGDTGIQRSVQDSMYFIGVVRQKINEITSETERLEKERDDHKREELQSQNMQRKVEELDKEVRTLEGTLADYNIALDKLRQGSDVSELQSYINDYEAKNRAFAHEIDRIFLQKQQEEAALRTVEQQIDDVYQRNQAKIDSMEPSKVQQYRELVQQNMSLVEESSSLQSKIDSVMDQLSMLRAQRESNTYNQEYRELEERAIRLQKQLRGLHDEHQISQMDPSEMHQSMLAKVKADNAKCAELDERIKQLREDKRSAEKTLLELQSAWSGEDSNLSEEMIEKLRARERDMNDFMEAFEANKQGIAEDMKRTQETIVGLLEHISNGIESQHNMPSKEKLRDMSDEATFKERQLESSQATMQRLVQEKAQRSQDLEKIQNLDEKIKMELQTLSSKMDSMKAEMSAFDDLDGLRQRAAETKSYLHDQLALYERRAKTTQEQVAGLRRKYESTKKQLEENETYKKLSAMEKKLKNYAQNAFTLQEYIETKGRESDFLGVKDNCMGIAKRLNEMIHERMNSEMQNLSEAPLSAQQQW